MLQFLKKIFKNAEPETKKPLEIGLPELVAWIEEKSKPFVEEAKQHTDEILMKISEEIERTRFNLEALENANLHNPNIPFKAKQYMEGNRKAYVKSISSFLGQLEINNRDYFYLKNFCKGFESLLAEVNSGTLRSYTILQEFFANEAGKIAMNLKNFDNMFKGLSNVLNDRRIIDSNGLKESIFRLKSKLRNKINLELDLKNAESSLKMAIEEKDTTIAEIERFNNSEENKSFLALVDEKKAKNSELMSEIDTIMQSFSVLERPLRKMSHISFEHEEIILEYINNPIDSLMNDKGLRILGMMEKLKSLIENGSIQIDEKKRERSIEEIKKLKKEYLEGFALRYNSHRDEMALINEKIERSDVQKKLKVFNIKLGELNTRIEKLAEVAKKIEDDFNKANGSVNSLIDGVQKGILDLFGEEIRVRWQPNSERNK